MSNHVDLPEAERDLTKVALFADDESIESHPQVTPARTSAATHPLANGHRTSQTQPVPDERYDGERVIGEGIDWALVRAFRQEAATQLTSAMLAREGTSDAERQEFGRKIILDLLSERARDADSTGSRSFDPDESQQLAEAIFDSLFGLGRLQPLVDNPDLENIEIRGCDNVHLIYADGTIRPGPAVADTDEELIDTLSFLAARSDTTERAFSPSNPDLDLRLPGGARLAASAWNTPRPLVVIRRHRLVDIDLQDLVDRGTLDPSMASFLRAAIRAKKSVVVSGAQGAGKTTLVRALCNEIDPTEAIGTIETEFELHLHEMGDRHPRCSPWEARPGAGEVNSEGRRIGEVTLDDILYRSLRMNLSRIIVGEVRGKEVIPMFKAMQAGAGSLSTTHSYSARSAVERLVTCATEAGPQISENWAYRQIAEHINIVVHVTLEDFVDDDQARRQRYVSEIIAIERGEDGRPAITDVYKAGPTGTATAYALPQWLRGLTRWGFDDHQFQEVVG